MKDGARFGGPRFLFVTEWRLTLPRKSKYTTVLAHRQINMPTSELEKYFPVLVQAIIAAVIAASLTLLSSILGKRSKSPQKDSPYECGMPPTGDALGRVSVKFYLVAMIFILLDIEAVFLYPWAVVYRQLKWFGFVEMLLFIVLVLVGYFYIWKKGALDWSIAEKPRKMKGRLDKAAADAAIREAA